MSEKNISPPRIAIFASGNGSNAQRIVEYFRNKNILEIVCVYCNNPKALVIERIKKMQIPVVVFGKSDFYDSQIVFNDLISRKIDWIVLAGFLWLIPHDFIKAYPKHIINIHPALLPDFGGKGMYGMRVHEAVIESGVLKSGITVHFVNEQYDKGDIIFQAPCSISRKDTSQILAQKIHELEYEFFPRIIEEEITKKTNYELMD